MSIDKLGDSTAPQPSQKASAADALRRSNVAKRDPAPDGDQVDMSMIGRLLARSVRALADSEEIRPEKIDLHKPLPRQNTRFDNATIDRILRRMQG